MLANAIPPLNPPQKPGCRAAAGRSRVTHPDAIRDLSRSLLDAGAAGADCWVVIGGGLVRSRPPISNAVAAPVDVV